jgi:cytochrome P450
MTDVRTYDPIDISDLGFWAQPARVRDTAFAELRRERPVSYHRPITFGMSGLMPTEDSGYWALATHELVRHASRSDETFCTSSGVTMEDIPRDVSEELASFLVMDGQRHRTLRRLVSSAFTPRQVARIEAQIARQARVIVEQLLETGDCDFVETVSRRLPMWTISEMIGIPEEERERTARAANTMNAANDPEFAGDGSGLATLFAAQLEIKDAATALAKDRRSHPRDDLMTALVQAEVDGDRLSDGEIAALMVLLSVAGNDTTRQTTSHGMKALCDNPDQRGLLREDVPRRIEAAAEEMIRWATPVMQFRRTATADVDLDGQRILAGEKVVLLYTSANRDEAVFLDPWAFDICRSPNDHLAFGGGGPHHCLGAKLARTQLRCLFSELVTRAPQLQVGEPEYLTANFIHGIKRMPCTLSA